MLGSEKIQSNSNSNSPKQEQVTIGATVSVAAICIIFAVIVVYVNSRKKISLQKIVPLQVQNSAIISLTSPYDVELELPDFFDDL